MKKVFYFLFAVILFVNGYTIPCNAQNKKTAKIEKYNKLAKQVKDSINNRHFTVNVNMAYPQSHRAINLTSMYSVRISGDSIISYLPYYGRAYNVPYGGGKALNFTGKIYNYTAVRNKKNMTRITLNVKTDEDTYKYSLEIFDNGSTSIDVSSNQRQYISFSGDMITK